MIAFGSVVGSTDGALFAGGLEWGGDVDWDVIGGWERMTGGGVDGGVVVPVLSERDDVVEMEIKRIQNNKKNI